MRELSPQLPRERAGRRGACGHSLACQLPRLIRPAGKQPKEAEWNWLHARPLIHSHAHSSLVQLFQLGGWEAPAFLCPEEGERLDWMLEAVGQVAALIILALWHCKQVLQPWKVRQSCPGSVPDSFQVA